MVAGAGPVDLLDQEAFIRDARQAGREIGRRYRE